MVLFGVRFVHTQGESSGLSMSDLGGRTTEWPPVPQKMSAGRSPREEKYMSLVVDGG